MRIILANRLLDRNGGEQKQLLELAHRLGVRGHAVEIISVYHDPAVHRSDVPIRAARGSRKDMPLGVGFAGRLATRLRAEREQAEEAIEWAKLIPEEAELINWHGANPAPAWLALRSRRQSAPWVWMCNDLPGPVYELAAESRVSGNGLRWSGNALKALPRLPEAIARARMPPGPLTVLDENNRRWWKAVFGRDGIVVPWGLDYERLQRPVRARSNGEPLRVLAAGIVSRFRRFEDTIRAVHQARSRGHDVRLKIVGEPADRAYYSELQALVSNLGIQAAVEFPGFLSERDYAAVRESTHALVLTTKGQTWGQVCTETAAMGIPAVINETATTLEFFRDGVSTLVARYADPSSIADKLVLLEKDEALRQSLAKNAQQLVGMFSWQRYALAMEEVFARTLAGAYT